MMTILLFCKLVIAYVLYNDMDSESAQTAVNMAFIIMGTSLSSYVFGAVYEDTKLGLTRESK